MKRLLISFLKEQPVDTISNSGLNSNISSANGIEIQSKLASLIFLKPSEIFDFLFVWRLLSAFVLIETFHFKGVLQEKC